MCSVDCANAKTWCDMNEVAPVSTHAGEGVGGGQVFAGKFGTHSAFTG